MKIVENWYFLSFSFDGKNQGCCNVQADTKEAALQKTIDLDIHPKHDDIRCYQIHKAELTPNKLYSPDELGELDYKREKEIICGTCKGNHWTWAGWVGWVNPRGIPTSEQEMYPCPKCNKDGKLKWLNA